jgi:hypothetical protein
VHASHFRVGRAAGSTQSTASRWGSARPSDLHFVESSNTVSSGLNFTVNTKWRQKQKQSTLRP